MRKDEDTLIAEVIKEIGKKRLEIQKLEDKWIALEKQKQCNHVEIVELGNMFYVVEECKACGKQWSY